MGRSLSFIVVFGMLGMLLCGCEINYLLSQGYHQIKLLSARRSLEDVLADPSISESLKERIRLVQAVCEFADKKLELKTAKSYRSFIEIEGPVVAYVVSACPKDRLEPYMWRFPLVGFFPYKGFFNLEEAKKEKTLLEKIGLDVHLAGATAFSSLGWFADPIYSCMLRLEDIELCYTIFHELVHATVFFPNQVEFNEQLATFVGWQSTLEFFRERKKDPHQTEKILGMLEEEQTLAHFLEGIRDELSSLYGSDIGLEEKLLKRKEVFERAKLRAGLLGQTIRGTKLEALAGMEWNNASFLALWRYRYDIGELNKLLSKLGGDLKALLATVISWQKQSVDPLLKLREEVGEKAGEPIAPPGHNPS